MNISTVIKKTLREYKAGHRFISLPENLPSDIPSHVKFHGIGMREAIATIVYRTERGFIGAQKRSDTIIDTEKLKVLAGVEQLALATPEELGVLGTEVGLVPLIGLNIQYFTDKKVLEIPEVYGGGGTKVSALAMNPHDVVVCNKSIVGDFTAMKKTDIPAGRRLLSGITPSGDGSLHIGNYLGAVRQFIELAKKNETFLMVADLHGLTTIQDKKQLQHNIETLILNELALLRGFLTEEEFGRIVFFRQSDVPMHTECQSIINNITPLGLLKRAHAYKDKLQKDVMEDDINVGLFSYPMLMASDIILYQADLVPVGKDQKQHIEITRDIAGRFNKIYKKNVFTLPDPYIPEEVAVVLGTDGKRKMSKSLGNIIAMFESEDVIRKQVMGTYTDPTRRHATDPGHIEGNMVFTYLDFFGEPKKVSELKEAYKKGATGDVEVKEYLFECILGYFANARKAFEELKANPTMVKSILSNGQARALDVATKTMRNVRDVIGVTTTYSFFDYPKSTAGTSITIDEFSRVEVRVGKVSEAKNKEGSEKLIRLTVDIGEESPRIIFTGVRGFGYTPEDFAGKQFLFITNLAYRKMLDEESQGMILAVDSADKSKPLFVSAEDMPIGAKIR